MNFIKFRLREAMMSIAPTQRQAAKAIGITEAAFSRYVNGQREPRLETLRKICQTAGYSADYILGIGE